MSALKQIFSTGLGELAGKIDSIVDNYVTTPDEKQAARMQVQQVVAQVHNQLSEETTATIGARARIIESEIQSDDKFVRRARPMVLYVGLFVICFNYLLVPLIQQLVGLEPKAFTLPEEYWYTWGGITGSWVLGRSTERVARGSLINKLLNPVTKASDGLAERLMK